MRKEEETENRKVMKNTTNDSDGHDKDEYMQIYNKFNDCTVHAYLCESINSNGVDKFVQ